MKILSPFLFAMFLFVLVPDGTTHYIRNNTELLALPFECGATCSGGQNLAPCQNCRNYFDCARGEILKCSLGFFFNPLISLCDFPSQVEECIDGSRPPDSTRPPTTTPTTTTIETTTEEKSTTQTSTTTPSPSTSPLPETTTEDPPIVCGIGNGYLPHIDCTKFYNCTDGVGIPYKCELGLYYSIEFKRCVFPSQTNDCEEGTRTTISPAFVTFPMQTKSKIITLDDANQSKDEANVKESLLRSMKLFFQGTLKNVI